MPVVVFIGPMTRITFKWILLLLVCVSFKLKAQSLGNVMQGYKNTWAAAGSYGGTFDGQSWFWGVSSDYTRLINKRWIINGSLAFDQETTRVFNSPSRIDNTFSLQLASGYLVNRRLGIGAGFAKGVLSNQQGNGSWNWESFGKDWATGLLAMYTFWFQGPHSLDITGALEYRINEQRWSYSLDIGYGYSF